jgi:hypothetical protein
MLISAKIMKMNINEPTHNELPIQRAYTLEQAASICGVSYHTLSRR